MSKCTYYGCERKATHKYNIPYERQPVGKGIVCIDHARKMTQINKINILDIISTMDGWI